MPNSIDMHKTSPSRLAALCQNTQPDKSHEPFCFELFQRAIAKKCSFSWYYLHHKYYRLVRYWVSRRAPPNPDAIEDLTQEAFAAFWRFYTPDKLARANDLGDVLAYLKTCAASAVTQLHRKAEKAALETEWNEHVVDTHAAAHSAETSAFEEVNVSRLWKAIASCCNDDRDCLLARLTLLTGLKPRHIAERYPEAFSDISEVYRVKRNLFDRLRRDPVLQEMCEKR